MIGIRRGMCHKVIIRHIPRLNFSRLSLIFNKFANILGIYYYDYIH